VCRQIDISVRVPVLVIHAIGDAGQVGGALPQYAGKIITEFAFLNFFGVFAADGGQVVGQSRPALRKLMF
jgi:hypothetical protein